MRTARSLESIRIDGDIAAHLSQHILKTCVFRVVRTIRLHGKSQDHLGSGGSGGPGTNGLGFRFDES